MHAGDLGHLYMERLAEFWRRAQKAILTGLAVAAALAVVVFFTLRARAEAASQAAGRLAEASLEFWRGNYQNSLNLAQQVANQYGGTPAAQDALRLIGDDQYWIGNFKESINQYRKYLEHEKKGMLADGVRRSLANALESDRQFAEAAKVYLELAQRLDRESAVDCMMGAARCYRATGRIPEAAQIYRRVADEFGETSLAATARLYLAETTVSTPKR